MAKKPYENWLEITKVDFEIGKEYEVLQQYATLEAIEGDTTVMRNRWGSRFEVDKK